jgi:hypothetical protein
LLEHAKDSFRLCSAATNKDYKMVLKDIKLVVERLRAKDSKYLEIMNALLHSPITLEFKRPVILGPYQVNEGSTLFQEKICNGTKPSAMLVFMTSSEAAEGKINKNAFNFEHFGISYAQVRFDEELYPRLNQAYYPDFASKKVTYLYQDFIELLGNDGEHGITMPKYLNGYTFIPFDLSSNYLNYNYVSPHMSGSTNLFLKFKAPLPVGIHIFVHALYENSIISIDGDRIVRVNYPPGQAG